MVRNGTLVSNTIGTSDDKAPIKYGTWINYWCGHTGISITTCATIGCNGRDLVGAHVFKVGEFRFSPYIIPLCRACNQKQGEFLVEGTLVETP